MEDENGRMAAMQAKFQEAIAKLREDLTARLRVEEAANQRMREEAQREKRETAAKRKAANRESEAKLERSRKKRLLGTSFAGQGGGNAADRRGTAVSSAAGGLSQNLQNFPRGIVPKLPVECSPSQYIAWEQRFEFFLTDQGLCHTIFSDAPEIAVISCTYNAYLFGQFGEDLVMDHRLVWWYISEATADAPFEDCLYECHFISDALRIMREWSLPLFPVERHMLVAELERVRFMGDEESEIVSSFSASSRNVHRTPMLLSSVVVFGTEGPWESEFNEGMTIWYLAAVACLGSCSSHNNTGLTVVACLGSSSSRCSTGFAVGVCRGSSNNSSNGLAALGFLISINVALMLSLPPGRRDNSYRCSNRHESLRSEVTGRAEVAPYLKRFLAVMAGLFRRHRRPAALFPRLHH